MARNVLVGVLACVALSLISAARAENDQSEYTLDIPRQPLTPALQEFSNQTRLGHLYLPTSPEQEYIRVGPLKGRYTVKAALTELLRPAGLTFSWTNPHQVSIETPLASPVKAQNSPPARPRSKRAAQRAESPTSNKEEARFALLGQVLVTARRYHGAAGERGAAVEVLEREAIERTGASTIFELLKYISQQPYLRPENARTDGAQYAELRGLAPDTTLILINGRRAPPSAGSFTTNAFDLTTVPLSAVERVEVLLDSASAVYGADAIGGIINLVLRDDIRHPSLDLQYGAAQGGGKQRRASASAGYNSDTVKSALMVDYTELGRLQGIERELWRNQDYRRFGSIDQRSINSSPGNFTSAMGNLPGASSPFAAIPEGMQGRALTPADLLYGQRNFESMFAFLPIVPETRRASAIASTEIQLTRNLLVAGELLYVDRHVEFPFLPPIVSGLMVPGTNPFNFFKVPVLVDTLLDGMERQQQTFDSTLARGAVSLRARLGSWDWELSLLRSEDDAELSTENMLDPMRLMQALASSDPNQALNVFRSGPAGSPELLATLVAAAQLATFANDASQVTGLLSGPIFRLPGGNVIAVLGSEWRSEAVQFDAVLGSFEREIAAGFAELRIPLFSAGMQVPGMHQLSLTVAGRLDDYTDFGSIFNPQYGLIWQPYRDLSVRASFGRSFRPPSMHDLFSPRLALTTFVPDPRRNGELASVTVVTGGNRDLSATRGESFTMGVVFSPQAIEPLNLSATYWRIAMDDRVTALPLTLPLANEARFADRVIRDPPSAADAAAGLPGVLRQIDVSRLNFGRLKTSGIDVGAAYERDTPLGLLSAELTATWIDKFEIIDLPATPVIDRVNLASTSGTIAKWRAVAMIGWSRGALGASTYLRYVPAYADTLNGARNGRVIPSQTIVDLQASLDLDELARGDSLWRGVKLVAGASNLFDQQPHFAEVNGLQGYDSSQGDLKGRFWYLRLGKTF